MTRAIPAFLTLVALLALPGCPCEVLVEEPDGPTHGLFTINQTLPNQALAGAWFVKVRKGAAAGQIELDHDGACRLYHSEPPGPHTSAPVEVDAGTLRVTGGLTDLVADFEGGYAFPEKTAIFEAGDVLTLDVEGSDDVAPMSVALTAPPLAVIAPPPATIDIGEDLTFTWASPPGAGTLAIQLQTYWPAVKTGPSSAVWGLRDLVMCQADISEGTLTMPASLLSQISDDGPDGARVSAYAHNQDLRHAGDSSVTFGVFADAAAPSGEAYQFDAELK